MRDIPDLVWNDEFLPLKQRAEEAVRRTLRLASESSDQLWSPDVEISDDPAAAAWQLAAVAPIGALDQMALLRSETMEALLTSLIELVDSAEQSLRTPWPDE